MPQNMCGYHRATTEPQTPPVVFSSVGDFCAAIGGMPATDHQKMTDASPTYWMAGLGIQASIPLTASFALALTGIPQYSKNGPRFFFVIFE